VLEGDAWLCTYDHLPLVSWGSSPSRETAPLHVDVQIDLWNRSPQLATVIGIQRATVNGQRLVESDLDALEDVTLEPGGPRERRSFALARRDGAPVNAKPGDTLELRLRLTRGGAFLGTPRRRFRLAGSAPG
jgi:hypothetical protein